jgi:adenine phosphoribosyltransferase
MSDPHNLKPFIRSVDDYPIPGIKFRDITSLLETPSAFATACGEMTALSAGFSPTAVIGIESRGFIFAGAIASRLSQPLVLARKPDKLPNASFSQAFDLEYGSTALEIQKNTQLSDQDRVVVVDDLIATGGTAVACAELLSGHFGVARQNILVLALIDLPNLGGSDAIRQGGFNVASLMAYT